MTLNSSFFLCCADAAAAAAIAPLKKNRQADLCGALKKKSLYLSSQLCLHRTSKGCHKRSKCYFSDRVYEAPGCVANRKEASAIKNVLRSIDLRALGSKTGLAKKYFNSAVKL